LRHNAAGHTRSPALSTVSSDKTTAAAKQADDEAPLRVLEKINLAIGQNEIVALLGPSGCGKSTVLRIIAGLIRPTKGEVLYHGEPLMGLNPGIAIVFQSFALYPWMTVTENIVTVLRAAGLPAAEAASRAAASISMSGLTGFEDAYPRELSGGMTFCNASRTTRSTAISCWKRSSCGCPWRTTSGSSTRSSAGRATAICSIMTKRRRR
jgi:ABC-type taurine transport system ATPase subunit